MFITSSSLIWITLVKTLLASVGTIIILSWLSTLLWYLGAGLIEACTRENIQRLDYTEEQDRQVVVDTTLARLQQNPTWRFIAFPAWGSFAIVVTLVYILPRACLYHLQAGWYLMRNPEVRARYRRRLKYRRRHLS